MGNPDRPRSHARWTWIAAAVIVVSGSVASYLAAERIITEERSRAAAAFERITTDIAGAVDAAVQREQDLAVSAAAFAASNPDVTNAELRRWSASVQLADRHPEVLGVGIVVLVPHDQVASYAALAAADPVGPFGEGGQFQIIPSGERPYYCFLRAMAIANAAPSTIPTGYDLCAVDPTGSFAKARDTGETHYVPGPSIDGAEPQLIVATPVYRDGTRGTTIAQRRAGLIAVIGTQIDGTALLDSALQGHTDTAVTLRYDRADDGTGAVTFHSRLIDADHRISTILDIGDGWTIETSTSHVDARILANAGALSLLVAGLVASVLLASLVAVLGTGRDRARRLVDLRTAELRHQALHDNLTRLPNRALITDRIEQMLARCRRHGTVGAALFIDVDEFKNVNDSLGHEAGDQLLRAVGERIHGALRATDTVGRMGGDEFVVLVDDAAFESSPELVAERLLDVLREPFQLDEGPSLHVSVSIGVASGDRPTGGDLLRDADIALYEAKTGGRNRYAVFDAGMDTVIRRRLELEFELRGALERGEFRLVYQPIIRIGDLRVTGVEALLRWDHPVKGAIEPDEFIPILEQTGQIVEVGRWVLAESCRQVAAWHVAGHRIGVSVNVSARQLDQDGIVHDVSAALADSGLEQAALTIEVTETALMRDPRLTADRLRAVKALGIQIAVDDFGTGYSSLVYLQRFPVDTLKIDRAFTEAIDDSAESRALLHAFVQLGKSLGLRTLVEGVETNRQLDHLRSEAVDEAQGYFFGRPLEPNAIEASLLGASARIPI